PHYAKAQRDRKGRKSPFMTRIDLRGGRRVRGAGVSLHCYNLAAMPCAEYDRLKEDWEQKSRAEASLHMSGYGRSIKAGLEKRKVATAERVSAETRWMNHIETCPVCQG